MGRLSNAIGFLGLVFGLLVLCTLSNPATAADKETGPAYDMLFMVYNWDPDHPASVDKSFYILDDNVLHVEYEKYKSPDDFNSQSMALYIYDSKMHKARKLPVDEPPELRGVSGTANFVVPITRHLSLDVNQRSPDGYVLEEPGWTKPNPVSNFLSHIFLLRFGFGPGDDIQIRERNPRLKKGSLSTPLTAADDILPNGSDTAVFLGWVVTNASK